MGESNFYSSRPGWTGAVFCAFGRVFAEGTNCMEQARTENKMGTMPIGKLLANMAVPMMVSMLVQAFYNVVDSVYVSQLNENALSAISLAFPLQNLMIAFGSGTAVGTNALLSRALGAKRHDLVDRAANTSIFLMFCNFAIFCVLGLTLSRTFFLAQTDVQQIVDYGASYTSICLGASIGIFAQFCFERLLQSTGRTKLSMMTQLIGAVINIVLDPILIFGLGMGVKGAAIATVLSQAVGAIWVIRFLTGPKTILKIRKEDMKLEGKIIMPVLALGISTFVMLSTESLLSISFSSSLARYGGDVAVGAMTVITSASQLCTMPISGICQGGQPVMSFNFGAGKKDRVKQAFRFQLTLCLSYTTIFWLLMMLVPGAVAGIFTSDASLIDYTTWAMRIYMAGIFAMGFQIACQQSFMALGQAKVSLLLACLRKLILLIPLIFILPHVVANPVFGVFLAEPVSDIIAAAVTATTFFLQFNKILDKGAGKV